MAADADGFAPGALILGRYRVEEAIGDGAFGRVVRAFDTLLKRQVAIKRLKRSLAADDAARFQIIGTSLPVRGGRGDR